MSHLCAGRLRRQFSKKQDQTRARELLKDLPALLGGWGHSMKSFLILSVLCSSIGYTTANCIPLPKNVMFKSVNFEHILHWEALPGDTAYSVQYKKYGKSEWLLKNDCQNIRSTFCNLTMEMNELKERYHARVMAVSKNCTSGWVNSERFSPEQTDFGCPALSYVASVRSTKFVIQPPYIPLWSKDGHQLMIETLYNYDIIYDITISNLKTNKMWKMTKKEKEIDVVSLDPDTEYNGTVSFTIQKMMKKSEERAFLVRTLPDFTWLQLLLGGLAFSVGFVALILCFVCYKYMRHTGEQPKSLDFKGMTPFQPMNPSKGHMISSSVNVSSWPRGLSSAEPSPNIPLHLHNTTKSQQPLAQPGNAYRPQTIYFQPLSKPSTHKDQYPFTSCSQFKQKYTLDGNSKNLSLTYGVCAQVTRPSNYTIYRSNHVFTDTPTDGISLSKINAPQYQCQTQIVADGSSESHPSIKPIRLDVVTHQHQHPQETRLLLNSSQMMLQTERENSEEDLPLLLSLLEEGADLRNYRPHPAGLLSLLSTVKVQEDLLSDSRLDKELPLSFPHVVTRTHGELIKGTECVFLESLTQTENDVQPFQYRMRHPQTIQTS